jgi:hypothetical protein
MALTTGFQLPFGIQPLNPVPTDSWSGPYDGINAAAAVAAANAAIPSGVRFKSLEVRLIINGTAVKYWYKDGITDSDLVPFQSLAATGVYLPLSGGVIDGNLTVTGIFSSTDTANWQSVYSNVQSNSAQWSDGTALLSSYNFFGDGVTTIFNLSSTNPHVNAAGYIVVLNGSTQTPYKDYTINYNSGTNKLVTLFTPPSGCELSVVYLGNRINSNTTTINEGGSTQSSDVSMLSSNWQNTYTSVLANSGSWNSVTDIKSLSSNWQNTYTSVLANSGSWNKIQTVQSLSGNWENTYTNVLTNSSNWQSVYTSVLANSSTWNSVTDVKSLSSNWQSTYTNILANSGSWNSTTDIKFLSGNWENTYTNVLANSSTWNSVTDVKSLSSNWENTYTNVLTNSGSWQATYSSVLANSGTWNKIQSFESLSGSWQATYSSVLANSGIWSSMLPLTGGTVTGNLLITGSLSALNGSTFVNTVFANTSALDINNTGLGPALRVTQGAGPGDIASFYDGDGVEVLHIGNALNPTSDGVVGVKTSYPNKTLTVAGEISAQGEVWASKYYGDGSSLTGILGTDTNKLPLGGGTLTGGLTGTTATFTTSISAPALSGTFYGDGSRLTGIVSPVGVYVALSGGTLTGGLTGTTATFTTSISAPTIQGIFYGDGSNLIGVTGTDTSKLPLAGGTLTGGLTGTTATFTTSVTAPAIRGTFYGDGSNLTSVVGTDTSKLPLAGGTLTGTLKVAAGTTNSVPLLFQTGTITSSPTANAIEWDGSQLYATSSSFSRRRVSYTDENVTIFSSNPANFATNSFYADTQEVHFYTLSATNNFIIDVVGSVSTYDSMAAVNSSRTICVINTSGTTAYVPILKIDGFNQSVRWQGNQSTGNPNSLDVWTFTIIKTGASAYTVLGSVTMYI